MKLNHVYFLKLYLVKGTAYEYFFRNADDPTKKRIWTERMEPYIDIPNYPTVATAVILCCRAILHIAILHITIVHLENIF